MMDRISALKSLCTSMLLLFCISGANAANLGDVRSLLELSGFTWHIARNNTAIEVIPNRLPKPSSADFKSAWAIAVKETFDADVLMAEIGAGVANRLSDGDVASLLTFLRTPAAARMKKIEQSGSNPNASPELRNAAEAELRRLGEKETGRLALYRKMAVDSRYVDRTEVMALLSLHIQLDALACSGQMPMSVEEVSRRVETARVKNRTFLDHLVVLNMVNAYEALNTDEVTDYADFLASEPAKAFYEAILEVTSGMFRDRSEKFRQGLRQALRSKDC